MTEQEFIEEHVKICQKKGSPSRKRYCAKSNYKYLLQYAPDRLENYNKVSAKERGQLLITNPNQTGTKE